MGQAANRSLAAKANNAWRTLASVCRNQKIGEKDADGQQAAAIKFHSEEGHVGEHTDAPQSRKRLIGYMDITSGN